MPITTWPKEDQPRQKLIEKGASQLTDTELLAIILNTGRKGMNAVELARHLLQTQNGLRNLLDHPEQAHGIGQAKRALLEAAIEIGRRYQRAHAAKGRKLASSQVSVAFIADRLSHHANEVFACAYLDNGLRLIQYKELFHGTINEANVYPREIVRHGLKLNAAKVILAHNHPSGNPTPSTADRQMTQVIQTALNLVDIVVIDHIIIGSEQAYSFAEHDLLTPVN